jgi:hypothetical protein
MLIRTDLDSDKAWKQISRVREGIVAYRGHLRMAVPAAWLDAELSSAYGQFAEELSLHDPIAGVATATDVHAKPLAGQH